MPLRIGANTGLAISGNSDADQLRSSGTQAGCDAVRLIAERLRQLHDPLGDIVGHQVALIRVKRAGHRRGVHAGRCRNLFKGREACAIHEVVS